MQTAGHDLVSFASKVTRGGIAQTSIRCAGRLELTGEANCPEQRPRKHLASVCGSRLSGFWSRRLWCGGVNRRLRACLVRSRSPRQGRGDQSNQFRSAHDCGSSRFSRDLSTSRQASVVNAAPTDSGPYANAHSRVTAGHAATAPSLSPNQSRYFSKIG